MLYFVYLSGRITLLSVFFFFTPSQFFIQNHFSYTAMLFLERFHLLLASYRLSVSFFRPAHWPPQTALYSLLIFCSFSPPEYLYLDDNRFTGSLPSELSKLSALRYFDANGNSLTGEIPLAYGKLTSLRGLNLGRNRLIGSLPVSFNEQLSQLEYLILDQNEMLGTLTPSIWQVASLAVLDLHQNRFSGGLPKIFDVNSLQVTCHLKEMVG
jgi:hypothetical protein